MDPKSNYLLIHLLTWNDCPNHVQQKHKMKLTKDEHCPHAKYMYGLKEY